MQETQKNDLSVKEMLALLIVGCAGMFGSIYLLPVLWGPYAVAFADAGNVALSRGAHMFSMIVLPGWAILLPLQRAKSKPQWVLMQLGTLVVAAAGFLGYGAYLHSIVHIQGLNTSLEIFADENGYKSVDAIPPHLKQAMTLSDKLAAEGKAPWLPGAWKRVDWPAIPANQTH
jgi:hypothetical protein